MWTQSNKHQVAAAAFDGISHKLYQGLEDFNEPFCGILFVKILST